MKAITVSTKNQHYSMNITPIHSIHKKSMISPTESANLQMKKPTMAASISPERRIMNSGMPMMIVQFKLEDPRTQERNPAKIPRVGAGGRHTNVVFDKSYENSRSQMYKEENSPLKSPAKLVNENNENKIASLK